LLLTGFAGALRRSEPAAIRIEPLEQTERRLRLTLPQTKGSQTDAVTVPLPYGQTELCPVKRPWISTTSSAGCSTTAGQDQPLRASSTTLSNTRCR